MLDQVLNVFRITPHYDLAVMKPNQDLFDVTASIVVGMRDVLDDYKPDLVLVQGDTTTSMVTSLASFYRKISVGHVEAGLRTGNIYSPWPEEINRSIIGRLARLHFAPTELSRQNLLREGIHESSIHVTGNTVIDSLLFVADQVKTSEAAKKRVQSDLKKAFRGAPYPVHQWMTNERRLVLITGHRRENFGQGFINICQALRNLAKRFPEIDWLYPVHMNPNVAEVVHERLSGMANVYLTKPLNYEPFVFLMSASYLVLTDSGGIQEEAPSLGKPVLVMRETTERPEAVTAGTVKLVGTKTSAIVDEVTNLVLDPVFYAKMSRAINPYGDGHASGRIARVIQQFAKNRCRSDEDELV
jgi:UDP-N-acetylglucosamine 2-epimerase (non-hydrolysing)